MTTTDPHPTSQDREVIEMAAATLLEVDQGQFEEVFELLVRCRTRDLLNAHPDAAPDHIIGWVQEFIISGEPSRRADPGRRRHSEVPSVRHDPEWLSEPHRGF